MSIDRRTRASLRTRSFIRSVTVPLYFGDERFRLVVIAAIVGVSSAFASIFLTRALVAGAAVVGHLRPSPFAFVLPAVGAALSSLLLRYIFRDAGGHGVTEVVYSVSRRGGLLRMRSAFSRLLSSLLTIASGGSAGPEAPVVISGATIGSNITRLFNANDRQRLVLVGCGAAGAIASIFNAPMAGIAFSLEAIFGEWRPVHLVPIAIASVAATEVSRLLQGNQIPFAQPLVSAGAADMAAALGLAALCAAGAVLLVRLLSLIEKTSPRLVATPAVRAACGGLLVGAIGIALPAVLGEGYETIRWAIEGIYPSGVLVVGAAALAKVVATAFTLGSGGSGGIFAPCLVIGSLLGVFYNRALVALSVLPPLAGESFFALLGMAGLLSSVLQAPLTGIFLIIEITGSYQLVAPVVLVAVVSATLSHPFEPYSVYHRELVATGALLRPRTDARVMADLTVREVLEENCVALRPEMSLREFVETLQRTRQRCFPVVGEGGRFLGMVDADAVRPYLFNPALHDTVLVEEIMDGSTGRVSPHDELSDIMQEFETRGVACLPVVQGDEFIGLISKANLLEHYRKELIVQEDLA